MRGLKKNMIEYEHCIKELTTCPSLVSKWLSGTHNFTIDTLTDIQRVLGIRLLDVEPRKLETTFNLHGIELLSFSLLPESSAGKGVGELSYEFISSRNKKQTLKRN